jgi:hypothetical protein
MEDSTKVAALTLLAQVLCPDGGPDHDFAPLHTKVSTRRLADLIDSALNMAMDNKVLIPAYDRLYALFGRTYLAGHEKNYETLMHRWECMEKVLRDSLDAASTIGVDPVVIKTIRTFPYVGSDIDLLVASEDEYRNLKRGLGAKGYVPLAEDLKSATMEKSLSGGSVLVDLHNSVLYAGGVPYLKEIWRYKIERQTGGLHFSALIPEAELVLLAAHSAFKEFNISFADFVYALQLIQQLKSLDKAYVIANGEGAVLGLNIFFETVRALSVRLGCLSFSIPVQKGLIAGKIIARIRSDINSSFSMPYVYPIAVPVSIYLDKLFSKPYDCFKGVSVLVNKYGLTHMYKYIKSSARL